MAAPEPGIVKVLGYEGFHDLDPKDPGGETLCGITRVFEPEWPGWAIVDAWKLQPNFPENMKKDELLELAVHKYYLGVWNSLSLSDIPHQGLAECIFNGCINQGKKRTVGWLQFCANALSASTLDVPEDGALGAGSIEQIKALCVEGYGEMLWTLLKAQRVAAYTVTCHNREDSRKYIKGWIHRLEQGG